MNQLSQTQNFGGGQMMGGQNLGLQQGGSQVVNPQTLQRIHQNSIFNGSNQSETALGGFGQGSMMSSMGGSFGGQLPNYGGQQNQSAGQMMGGQSMGMQAAGFGGQQNRSGQMMGGQMMGGQGYGMQQGGQMVNPQTIQRIHQNSIFQGKSQPDYPEVERIHQNSIFGGHSQFDGTNTMQAGFGGGMGAGQMSSFGGGFMAGQLPNYGGQQNRSGQMMGGQMMGGQMMGGQGMQMQGGDQVVTPQAIQRIHENSIFQGKSQLDYPELQRIHQNSIFNGHSQFDGTNTMQAGFGGQQNQFAGAGQMGSFGGGFMAGQLPNFGGQQNRSGQMMGGQMMGGQGMQMQGGAQVVSPQVLQRIHDQSIFQGKYQLDYPEIQRIHQNSIFAGHSQFDGTNTMQSGFGGGMGAGQMSSVGGGFMAGQLPNFGGQQNRSGQMMGDQMMGGQMMGGQMMGGQMMGGQGQQQMVNTAALNSVLNADAGIQDNEGPSRYPASMYTGSNQYDQVNQAVLQQMGNMGQASQAFGSF